MHDEFCYIPRFVTGVLFMSSVQSPTAWMSSEEFLELPDNKSMELVYGQIVEKPVSAESSEVEGTIYTLLRTHANKTGSARVFPASLGYQCFRHLSDDPHRIRKPDSTVIRAERIRALSNPNPGLMPIIPDLAVEVLSTNDKVYEVIEKIREYREAGFPLVWVVDPLDQTVTVYPNPGKPVILTSDDEIRAESALPGFVCRVAEFFENPIS